MNDLLQETNVKLEGLISELEAIKNDYIEKIKVVDGEIAEELGVVKKYKDEFFDAKEKIEKTNNDIQTFEKEYNSLVEKFKDDEIGAILLGSNHDLEAKIEEKKQKIMQQKRDINGLIQKAEMAKDKLVKLTAEKKILELRQTDVEDIFEYYKKALEEIIEYTKKNEKDIIVTNKRKEEEAKQKAKEEEQRKKEEEQRKKEEEKKAKEEEKKKAEEEKKKKDKKDSKDDKEESESKPEEEVKEEEKTEEVKIEDEFTLPDEDEITFDFDDLEKIINFDDNLDN